MAGYTFLLENEIKQIVSKEFVRENYHQDFLTINLKMNQTSIQKTETDSNAVYILMNETLDIPVQSTLFIMSDDNFVQLSKTEYENIKEQILLKFRGNKMRFFIENVGDTTTELNLYFLKITPY